MTNNTPADTTAPSLVSAAVNDTTLVMTFDEELDENAVPAATAFGMVYTTDGRSVQPGGS